MERLPPRFWRGLRYGLAGSLVLWAALALVVSEAFRHAYVRGLDIVEDWLHQVVGFDPRFLAVSLCAAVVLARVSRPCSAR